jgi:hypothetical protein
MCLRQALVQIADEGFDGVHQFSVVTENLPKEKILGKISVEEAEGAKEKVTFEAPPIDSILNLYDIEQVAHASMKDTSWGYYATGSMDEFTKCVPMMRCTCLQCGLHHARLHGLDTERNVKPEPQPESVKPEPRS